MLLPWLVLSSSAFIPLGDLQGGQVDSSAYAISADGRAIVGRGTTEKGNRAFLYRFDAEGKGEMTLLADPSADTSESGAFGVNTSGTIIGGRSGTEKGQLATSWVVGTSNYGVAHGDFPGGEENSSVLAVSSDGLHLAGRVTTQEGPTAATFRMKVISISPLGDLPGGRHQSVATSLSHNGSKVVGFSASANGIEAFLWTESRKMVGLGDHPDGAFGSRATDISDDGEVVIGVCTDANGEQPCRWTEQKGWEVLKRVDFATARLEPRSISADKKTIVGIAMQGETMSAFIWTEATGIMDLREYLLRKGLKLPDNFKLTAAQGVSGDGRRIVGHGKNAREENEAWLAILP